MEIERALRMVVKHSALTRDGIHFNSQKGRQWINDALQTNIEEMEGELRTMINPVTRDSPAGRVRSRVCQTLANCLGLLATKAIVTQPTLVLGERYCGPSPLSGADRWRTELAQ